MSGISITMFVLGVTVAAIVFFLLLSIVIVKLVFRTLEGPLQERVAARYRPDEIVLQDLRANSFGRESTGRTSFRGNGALVLTARQLHFFMAVTKSEVVIALDTITELSLTHSHLGKHTSATLLKILFSTDGQPDSMAWYLPDPQAWKSRIEALMADQAPR